MRILMSSRWLLFFLLITTCVLITSARRGGGGSRGGSRGSSSRGSSSRGSSSSSSGSRNTHYDRGGSSRDRGRTEPKYQPPPPPPPPPPPKPKPQPKPSAPEVVRQPAVNPNFKESNPSQGSANRQPAQNPNYKESSPGVNQQPPPYSPRENPPPYSPNQGAPPPPYNPHGSSNVRQPNPGEAPPPYPGGGVPGANYPRQPGMPGGNYPQQSGVPGANYPRQPGMPGANYPQQGGVPGANYPQQGGIPGANYPRQPGGNYPQQGGVNYPQQPGTFGQPGVGVPGANYPRQAYYPPNTLGSKVWQPESGRPAPAYMNYGGLPTGSNIRSKTEKKKGFLGSLISMGSHKPKKNKYFGSQPSPYGMGSMSAMGGGRFIGKHGSTAAMHTILPYMETVKSPKFSRPRYGYHSIFGRRPLRYHQNDDGQYSHTHYDVYNDEYVGSCNRPLSPDHGKVVCNSTRNEVNCNFKCEDGYILPDNTTIKWNNCWHYTGVWKPMKNFPACKPVCNRTCLNGGTCVGPDSCRCPPEYRGLQCEFYFLKCDIRELANGAKITWVCRHSRNETICNVKCEDSLLFATSIEEVYTCSPDGVWTSSAGYKCLSMAGPPGQVQNCLVTNYTSDTIHIQCQEVHNGGLELKYHLEVRNEEREYLKNITSQKPVFNVQDLKAETVYILVIYATNISGKSPSVAVVASTEIAPI